MPSADRYNPLERKRVESAGEVRQMNDPDTQKAIKEAIDACRPGADDASLPEMSQLADSLRNDDRVRGWYDHTQQSDVAIGRAFRDVPIPEGLAARLAASVQKEGEGSHEGSSSLVDEAAREQDDLNAAASVAVPASRRKRWSGVAIVGISLAVVLLMCFFLFRPASRDIVIKDLPREVNEWIEEAPDWTDWNADLAEAPVDDYPRDARFRASPRRWRVAGTRYDSRTIVYDISRPGDGFAYVFCIHTKGRAVPLPTVPPSNPRWTTGGVAIGAWQRNGMTYIVAVQGGKQRYREFVGPSMELG